MTSDSDRARSSDTAPSALPAAPAPAAGPGVIDSAQLFNGATELRLRHRGDEYRLRITRQGKLILTK